MATQAEIDAYNAFLAAHGGASVFPPTIGPLGEVIPVTPYYIDPLTGANTQPTFQIKPLAYVSPAGNGTNLSGSPIGAVAPAGSAGAGGISSPFALALLFGLGALAVSKMKALKL